MAFGSIGNGTVIELTPEQLQDIIHETLLRAHPIGSIYQSEDSTDPSTLFGGTWERIEGKFIIGASDTYPVGSTGGEETHTLTLAEMPNHTHYLRVGNKSGTNKTRYIPYDDASNVSYWVEKVKATETDSAGGGKPHNNIPPYYSTYIWRRVA